MSIKLKLFDWRAVNTMQQKQRGSLVAESESSARQKLIQQGLQQIKLQRNWQLNKSPKNGEICELLLQLATMLQAAVPLKNSLQILLQNNTNIQLYQWLTRLIQQLDSGLSFSQALQQQPTYLSYQEQQLIKVGEMTGKLPQVCSQLASYKQQALALQRKMQKILLYPTMVLAISLILTSLLLVFIVPQFAEMYANNQANLPTFTQVLLSLSNLLQSYWWLLLPFLGGFSYGIKSLKKQSQWFNQKEAVIKEGLPVLGKIIQLERLVSFCRSLGLMLQSGVPLNQALQSFLPQGFPTQKTLQGDLSLINQIQQMLYWLKQGYPFSKAVGTQLFPAQAQQMLQVGEQSGQLAKMLQYIAENYQQQLDHQIDLLSQMLEPLLMVVIGGLIGLIMLGMYLPIFNLGSLIQ